MTDNDLKILLRNFSDLTEEEQKDLIKYLLSRYVDNDDVEDDDYEPENDVNKDYASNVKDSQNPANELSADEYDEEEPPPKPVSFPNYQ